MQQRDPRPDPDSVELPPAAGEKLTDYLPWAQQAYRDTWGREMRDGDPLFPDWDGADPVFLDPASFEAQMVAVLEHAGVEGAHIYAFQHSGILLTESNEQHADPDAVAEWHAALARYDALRART